MSSLKAIRMKEFFDALRVRQVNKGGALTAAASVNAVANDSLSSADGDGIVRYTPQLILCFVIFAMSAIFLFIITGAYVDRELGERCDKDTVHHTPSTSHSVRILKLMSQIVFNVAVLLALYYLPPLVLSEFRLLASVQKNVLYLVLFGIWAVALSAQTRLRCTFAKVVTPMADNATHYRTTGVVAPPPSPAMDVRSRPVPRAMSLEIQQLQQQLEGSRSAASDAEKPANLAAVHKHDESASEHFSNLTHTTHFDPHNGSTHMTAPLSYTFIDQSTTTPSRQTFLTELGEGH